MKRIWKVRPPGIRNKSNAPFWSGERAEDIVARRVRKYVKEKKLAALKRRKKRKAKRK